MRNLIPIVLAVVVIAAPAAGAAESRPVDVAVVLDASGSMEDLLDAVRARVWDVVLELSKMSPEPDLRVGLVTFGTFAAGEEDGWIVVHSDLTRDLDAVYAELMAVRAEGNDELVGRALGVALDRMSWCRDWNALRVIFIAGNESADQGVDDFDFRVAAAEAADRGIIVNSLFAGNREQAVVEKWPEIARVGSGNFSAIDPEVGGMQIATPQDEPLLALNRRLNATYVPYGPRGADGLANQTAQDGNASRLGVQSCSSRIVTKGTALYTNASWDLVDRSLADDFAWDDLEIEDLPEEMRSMTDAERSEFVATKRAERESIQSEIRRLSELREAHIRGLRERDLAAGVGEAMRRSILEQAAAKGFTCEGC